MSEAILSPFLTAKDLAKAIESDTGLVLDEKKLSFYASEILEKGKQFNLTGHDSLPEIYSQLFYDSLFPYAGLQTSAGFRLLDVGSGSGVPGLLLAMALPKTSVVMIESNAKKSAFISEVASRLRLANLTVLNQRAELLDNRQRESFDVVTARAVAPLHALLELLAPFAKVGGTVICPKSHKYDEESLIAAPSVSALGLRVVSEKRVKSATGLSHVVATYVKVKPTPPVYPRSWAAIKNEPIK